MTARRGLALAAFAGALATAGEAGAQAQPVDSVLARIEGLAISQDRAAARVLADSLLAALPPGDRGVADALYWRGFSSSNAADAERDYLRVSVEFPLSPRAPEALLALAQLEYARGDRVAARRRFDRLLREYPSGRHVARASYWSGRLAMDEGDDQAACSALRSARLAVTPGDVELTNQIEYLLGQCAIPVLPRPDTSTRPPSTPTTVPAGRTFSVQVAAYSSRGDANTLATRLRDHGFDVRVVGTRAPYRVRIGRYPTRAAAVADLPRIRAAGLSAAFVVEAEPR
jgi:cell division septation protein DedD